MLMHFRVADLAIELPRCAGPERCRDQYLWRIKLDNFSVQADARHANHSALIHGYQIRVCYDSSAVHLELEKILVVNFLCSIEPIGDSGTKFPINIGFEIGKPESLAKLLSHIVVPSHAWRCRDREISRGYGRR